MALIDFPPNWKTVTDKAAKVDGIKPEAIEKAAQQFKDAASQAGDHSAALKSSTDSLASGVWQGDAADAFVGYVRQITTAGDKVQGHLTDVGNDLSQLSQNLATLKGKVTTARDQAHTSIQNRINTETPKAQAAQKAEADYNNGDKKGPAPSPSSQSIIDAANKANAQDATNAEQTIDPLLTQADGMVKSSQQLMQKQIEGGYSKVPLPGKDGTVPQGHGGIHTHGGGGGGGAGGGGGLGPSGGPPSSPPPGNVQEWIQEAIKILQANGVNVTDADIKNIWAIIQHESGGNPNAINNWDCVPLDTAILTKRGWLKHHEVEAGDKTIGYNPETGCGEWTEVTRVVHHDNARLVTLAGSDWHATTTPNHRWLDVSATTAGEAAFVTSDEIGGSARILLAAPAETGAELAVTVREAATLGRLAVTGVVGLDHDVQDLLRRTGDPKTDAVRQVLAMSAAQREAWLEAVTDARGTRHSRPGDAQPEVTIRQAPGEVLEAITLAVYLSGARPRVSAVDRTAEREPWRREVAVQAISPEVTGALLRREEAGRADVWCVTTELGTWTAREADGVFLTGNSNAAAGHPSKGLMQCIDSTFNAHKLPGHDNIYNPVDNIIAGVRYSIDRYGSIGNVPGIQAMAHGGAYRGY